MTPEVETDTPVETAEEKAAPEVADEAEAPEEETSEDVE